MNSLFTRKLDGNANTGAVDLALTRIKMRSDFVGSDSFAEDAADDADFSSADDIEAVYGICPFYQSVEVLPVINRKMTVVAREE